MVKSKGWIIDDAKDDEEFTVIRDMRSRPIAYVDKSLSPRDAARVAGLIAASVDLSEAVKEIVLSHAMGEDWTHERWRDWRKKHGQAVAISMGII